MRMAIGDDVYTTDDHVRFCVLLPSGEFGELVIDIAPGETKTVTLPPNGKIVTIHRPLLTPDSPDA